MQDDVARLESAGVHEHLSPLGEHPPGRQDDRRAGRSVDVRAEQRGGGEVAVGGVVRQALGQQGEVTEPVDAVVEVDPPVVREVQPRQ
ncbi:hypothetical protein ASG36_00560 [Geodermatophilus sp. Leaf369]|nr:hypothetical protein ASG36_00560 [Geodermatophilus sp. Leaf369]